MAHALLNYDGLCKNIHGHSYTLVVTVKGTPIHDAENPKNGMLIDFGDLKKIIKEEIVTEYDHALVLNEKTSHEVIEVLKRNFDKIVLSPYQPTTENMLADFAARIKVLLPSHLVLYSLRLRETETSFGEWYAEDNK
jgi:6-pyruvoyltetrahydropterin/6-carboxytetrahydropterin synthase